MDAKLVHLPARARRGDTGLHSGTLRPAVHRTGGCRTMRDLPELFEAPLSPLVSQLDMLLMTLRHAGRVWEDAGQRGA